MRDEERIGSAGRLLELSRLPKEGLAFLTGTSSCAVLLFLGKGLHNNPICSRTLGSPVTSLFSEKLESKYSCTVASYT